MSTDLPPQFEPAKVEGPLSARWEELGVFNPDNAPAGAPAYTVVIPPPNVTGSLHMGHAFEHTLMDAITRRARMQGYATLWLPGTDHAAIAVETLVERSLAAEGTSKAELGRDAFLARAWAWKDTYGGRILDQMRRLGDGVDWSRLRFTLDEGPSRAVRTMFTQLFDAGLIYRAERLVNWSPVLQTAISDIEVEHRETEGELVTIDYGSGVRVATTRVETMLGDTAVAVHPDDERYRHLVGSTLTLPIVGRQIPVVADDHVDPEFGTGAVKVTPAHDPNDFAIGVRHGLPSVSVLDAHARVTGTGTRFDGMDRYDARAAVTEELRSLGLVTAVVRPYVHSVGHSSRSGEVVEPRLSLQWYVAVGELARRAGDAVRDGETAFVPPEMAARYFDWVDDMHDWCISRQLWWGHRIPIWYGPDGEVVCPAEGEEPTGEGWHQDPDVLDTWFSSALWPVSTLGWPAATPDLARFYPTTTLVTGYDIIFFWVARMMMFCTVAQPDVPFGRVLIHGLVRDPKGKKMSKTTGNVIDPLEWMDTYGTDALRLALARGANPGVDFPLSEDKAEGARRFCTKVWHATRFALLNGASVGGGLPPVERRSVPDRWVLSRLTAVTAEADRLAAGFEFARLVDVLHEFAWHDVFDWYVELAKAPLQAGGRAADDVRAVLGHVLEVLLRLLHPITPFLTDELWTALTGGTTVVTAPWPVADAALADADAEAVLGLLQGVVTEVRRARTGQGVADRRRVQAVVRVDDLRLVPLLPDLAALGWLDLVDAPVAEPLAAVAPGATVLLDLTGVVDPAAERARNAKQLAAAQDELAHNERRLASPAAGKAPPAVVAGWRSRAAELAGEVGRLHALLGHEPVSG